MSPDQIEDIVSQIKKLPTLPTVAISSHPNVKSITDETRNYRRTKTAK